jgi:RIO kinase 2
MKLDPTVMRTMNRSDFRVLAAVEQGMVKHELVPLPLITSIANLRHGGTHKIISSLLRDKLLSHDRSCGYDGYRLTNAGYDILALHQLKQLKILGALGMRIGTGKESDVYLAATPDGTQVVLKFHRLGRTSFRNVKQKRDYFNYNAQRNPRDQPNSWLFLSSISARKEYAFMKALHDVGGYTIPTPLSYNRHIVCMSLIRGVPLYQVHANRVSLSQAQSIAEQSISIATRLASHGLVHCDLNEFNLMVDFSGIQHLGCGTNDTSIMSTTATTTCNNDPYVRHSGLPVELPGALSAHLPHSSLTKPSAVDATGERITEPPPEPQEFLDSGEAKPIVTLIDFPQMVSTNHPNAQELYERDMACLQRFFAAKLKVYLDWEELIPKWDHIIHSKSSDSTTDTLCLATKAQLRLDTELQASGYSTADSYRDTELYYHSSMDRNPYRVDCVAEDDDDGTSIASVDKPQALPRDGNNVGYIVPQSSHLENDGLHESSLEEKDSSIVDATCWQEEDEDDNDTTRALNDPITAETTNLVAEQAKMRLRKYKEDEKRRKKQQGAFRTRNINKSYLNGRKKVNPTVW